MAGCGEVYAVHVVVSGQTHIGRETGNFHAVIAQVAREAAANARAFAGLDWQKYYGEFALALQSSFEADDALDVCIFVSFIFKPMRFGCLGRFEPGPFPTIVGSELASFFYCFLLKTYL